MNRRESVISLSSTKKQILMEEIKSTIYESTFHGLPRFFISLKKKHWLASIMWIILFLASFSYCAYTIVTCFLQYYKYGVVVEVTDIQTLPAPFPAVTICNINPFNEEYAQAELLRLDSKASCFLPSSGISFEDCVDEDDPQMAFKDLIDQFSRTIANDEYYTYNNLLYIGYQLQADMLVSCEYNGVACTATDFKTFWNYRFGLCHTFNANSSLATSEAGSSYGLKMELVVGKNKFYY